MATEKKGVWDLQQVRDQYLNNVWTYLGDANAGELYSWGYGTIGRLGQNDNISRSSPIQVPGTQWKSVSNSYYNVSATKTDATLWAWGYNATGALGQNSTVNISSPVQIPGTQWSEALSSTYYTYATKTDGTLWGMGRNTSGQLGQNELTDRSSPVQIPGTQWSLVNCENQLAPMAYAIKKII